MDIELGEREPEPAPPPPPPATSFAAALPSVVVVAGGNGAEEGLRSPVQSLLAHIDAEAAAFREGLGDLGSNPGLSPQMPPPPQAHSSYVRAAAAAAAAPPPPARPTCPPVLPPPPAPAFRAGAQSASEPSARGLHPRAVALARVCVTCEIVRPLRAKHDAVTG